MNHLNAALIIKPHDTLVHGGAEFTFGTLREQIAPIVFDVRGLDIEWITIGGVDAVFSKKGRNAIIYPPAEPGWQIAHRLLLHQLIHIDIHPF